MTIKHSLLAILEQSPCYGNQLRTEFERRTAHTWPVNVGQVYNTLERLERDGYVTRGTVNEHGHVLWHITPSGRAVSSSWFQNPTPRGDTRDELAAKVALAITLPGVDAAALIETELASAHHRLTEATRVAHADDNPLSALVHLSAAHRAQSDVDWLLAAQQFASQAGAEPSAIDSERPRRGRPKKAVA